MIDNEYTRQIVAQITARSTDCSSASTTAQNNLFETTNAPHTPRAPDGARHKKSASFQRARQERSAALIIRIRRDTATTTTATATRSARLASVAHTTDLTAHRCECHSDCGSLEARCKHSKHGTHKIKQNKTTTTIMNTRQYRQQVDLSSPECCK